MFSILLTSIKPHCLELNIMSETIYKKSCILLLVISKNYTCNMYILQAKKPSFAWLFSKKVNPLNIEAPNQN